MGGYFWALILQLCLDRKEVGHQPVLGNLTRVVGGLRLRCSTSGGGSQPGGIDAMVGPLTGLTCAPSLLWKPLGGPLPQDPFLSGKRLPKMEQPLLLHRVLLHLAWEVHPYRLSLNRDGKTLFAKPNSIIRNVVLFLVI